MSYVRRAEVKRILDRFEDNYQFFCRLSADSADDWQDKMRPCLERALTRFGKKERNEVRRQEIVELAGRVPVRLGCAPHTCDYVRIEGETDPSEYQVYIEGETDPSEYQVHLFPTLEGVRKILVEAFGEETVGDMWDGQELVLSAPNRNWPVLVVAKYADERPRFGRYYPLGVMGKIDLYEASVEMGGLKLGMDSTYYSGPLLRDKLNGASAIFLIIGESGVKFDVLPEFQCCPMYELGDDPPTLKEEAIFTVCSARKLGEEEVSSIGHTEGGP